MNNTSKFPLILFATYAAFCVCLSINPVDRGVWFAENLTVWIIVGILTILYASGIRFSNLAYALAAVLIFLHTVGGHYTFAKAPFGFITDIFGFERNNFDRLAHFTVGFYAFAVAEWLWNRKLVSNRFLLFTYPVFVIAATAMTYEIVEWVYAASSSPEAGAAFLGSQGDIWDAQKDMLADTLGAIFAVLVFFAVKRPKFPDYKTAQPQLPKP